MPRFPFFFSPKNLRTCLPVLGWPGSGGLGGGSAQDGVQNEGVPSFISFFLQVKDIV